MASVSGMVAANYLMDGCEAAVSSAYLLSGRALNE